MALILGKKPVPYDKYADATTTAAAALSTFEGVVRDLEYSSQLLTEVEAEARAEAQRLVEKADAAADQRDKNVQVAERIRALIDG